MQAPWATAETGARISANSHDLSPPGLMVATVSDARVLDNAVANSLLMVLAAVDGRGVFAGVAYEWTTSGIAIDGLDLEAPARAMPVMRGITRIAPGCPIPSLVPLAIKVVAGRPVAIACDPRSARLDYDNIEQAPFRIVRDPVTRVVRTDS